MPQSAAPNTQADANQLEAATDQAIAACGGNARDAVKALLVANAAVSTGYPRGYKFGRFKTYAG